MEQNKTELEQEEEVKKISQMTDEQALEYIRDILIRNTPPYDFNNEIIDNFGGGEDRMRMRLRFEMSGYDDGNPGSCVLHNMKIVNLFAHLGIYDYTEYLYLDFYKGNGFLYYKYWPSNTMYGSTNMPFKVINFGQLNMEENLGGYTTSEIIYKILKLTILSGRPKRRRN